MRGLEARAPKPKWWQMFALLPMMVGLFVLNAAIDTSPRGHEAILIGIVVVIFGGMVLWMRVNAPALLNEKDTDNR